MTPCRVSVSLHDAGQTTATVLRLRSTEDRSDGRVRPIWAVLSAPSSTSLLAASTALFSPRPRYAGPLDIFYSSGHRHPTSSPLLPSTAVERCTASLLYCFPNNNVPLDARRSPLLSTNHISSIPLPLFFALFRGSLDPTTAAATEDDWPLWCGATYSRPGPILFDTKAGEDAVKDPLFTVGMWTNLLNLDTS